MPLCSSLLLIGARHSWYPSPELTNVQKMLFTVWNVEQQVELPDGVWKEYPPPYSKKKMFFTVWNVE